MRKVISNWADNVTFYPQSIHYPLSPDKVIKSVNYAVYMIRMEYSVMII